MPTPKSIKTINHILEESHKLFAVNGYKSVTMSDICNATGLSRGGLYRHFSGTDEILQRLIGTIAPYKEDIEEGVPAVAILDKHLKSFEESLMKKEYNLALAILEYASVSDREFFDSGNAQSVNMWRDIIEYGIKTGEFREGLDPTQAAEVILYLTQGALMWADAITIKDSTITNIVEGIRRLLCKDSI